MFVELHYPEYLSAQELDVYLANGWFRMGQSIFTTNFLRFHDKFYSSIWLRIDLLNSEKSKTQQKIEKLNAKFRVEIQIANAQLACGKSLNGFQSSVEMIRFSETVNDLVSFDFFVG